MDKLNLVPAIKILEEEIRKLGYEFDKQIQPYRDSLSQLRKINQACERCNGTGKVLRSRACAEDDRPNPNDPMDWNKCPICGGSGLSATKKVDK